MSPPAAFDPFDVELAGRNVVTASAGTGKTYAISALVVRLVVERDIDVRRILVVTFTEAATAELRGRIRLRLSDAREAYRLADRGGSGDVDLDRYVAGRGSKRAADRKRIEIALERVDEAPISTIHGFCRRMLQDGAFESNTRYDAELATDVGSLRDEVLHDAWASFVANQSPELLLRVADRLLPNKLRGLSDKVARAPDLPILTGDFESGATRIIARLRELWDADRAVIEGEFTRILVDPPKRPGTLTDWFRQMDAFLREGTPAGDLPTGVRKLGRGNVKWKAPPVHPFFVWCRRLRHHWKRRDVIDPDLLELTRRIVDYVRAELPRRKEERGILSFDDLLLSLARALAGPSGEELAGSIRGQFEAALIDEFQDTDSVQLAIFDAVYGSADRPLFLIGDPKQAIYSFRGADLFTYLEAVSKPGVRRHTMGVSWRSDPALLRAVNAIFTPGEGAPPPFVFPEIDYPEIRARPGAKDAFVAAGVHTPEPFEVLFAPRVPDERVAEFKARVPALVAGEISSLIRSGSTLGTRAVHAGDVAVLTRTNQQCFDVQAELRTLGIPAIVIGDRSVFESPEALELQRVLGAIVEPSRTELRKALSTELLSVSANQLANMEKDAALWDEWTGRFRDFGRLWVEKGFVQMFDALLTEARIPERLLRLVDGDRRLTNLLHLMELLRNAADESHLGPTSLLHWLAVQRSDTKKQAEHAEIRLESDEAAVKLTTIHKSKGLEYPIVYCPYLWDGWLLFADDRAALRFHDPEDGFRLKLDLGSGAYLEHLEHAELEALAENVRLLYVALTRARHRVTIVWGAFPGIETTALGSLLHPPDVPPGEATAIRHYADRYTKVDDENALAAIEARRAASAGAIGVRSIDGSRAAEPAVRKAAVGSPLAVRTALHVVAPPRRIVSFSGLTRAAPVTPDPRDGKDHDGHAEADAAATSGSPARPIVLHDFARGAAAGTFYHSVLEHLDFQNDDSVDEAVRRELSRAGYDVARWTAPVARSVREVLAAPLFEEHAVRLSDVPITQRRAEMEFHLPVADGPSSRLPSAAALARVFGDHPSPAVPESYAGRVATLGFADVAGFLKGYIDLVFEHEGRFYVADYKTNFLGTSSGDYAASKLGAAMAHGHYFLQYHLYSLAVHRYLERRVPGYRYETHFGGAVYLFVRGMSPELAPGHGVFFEKPPRERIRALSALLDGNAPGGPS